MSRYQFTNLPIVSLLEQSLHYGGYGHDICLFNMLPLKSYYLHTWRNRYPEQRPSKPNDPSLVLSHYCLHRAINIYNFVGSSWWEWLSESHPHWLSLKNLFWYILQASCAKNKHRPLCPTKSCCQYDVMRQHDYMIHHPLSHPKTGWFFFVKI